MKPWPLPMSLFSTFRNFLHRPFSNIITMYLQLSRLLCGIKLIGGVCFITL